MKHAQHRRLVVDLGKATSGVLTFVGAKLPFDARRPDLSDCFVIRHFVEADPMYLRPARRVDHLIDVWEPLPTNAPGPALAQPFCCYASTIIFYARPYAPSVRLDHSRWRDGIVRTSARGFGEYDRIDYRLRWEDVVEYGGDRFMIGGGTVIWAARAGDPVGRRWWMHHGARRMGA